MFVLTLVLEKIFVLIKLECILWCYSSKVICIFSKILCRSCSVSIISIISSTKRIIETSKPPISIPILCLSNFSFINLILFYIKQLNNSGYNAQSCLTPQCILALIHSSFILISAFLFVCIMLYTRLLSLKPKSSFSIIENINVQSISIELLREEIILFIIITKFWNWKNFTIL